MIDIEDTGYKPTVEEMSRLASNPLFDRLCSHMDSVYQPKHQIDYSGDKQFLGWNLKFKKAGRTLCTLYPRQRHFFILLVVGQKEKERVEALLPSMSPTFRDKYNNTPEGIGQRWLMFDFTDAEDIYNDALEIIRIRRESK